MTKLILFDLGNVLVYYDHAQVVTAVNRLRRLPHEEMVTDTAVIRAFVTGQMDGYDFYQYLRRHGGLDADYTTFTDAFCVQPSRDEAALKTAVALQQRPGVQVGIISNTNAIHSAWLRRHVPELALFAPVLLSNEVGLQKPDPAIYENALAAAKMAPIRAMFVDDLAENVAAARALGLAAIQHRNWVETRPQLEAWLRPKSQSDDMAVRGQNDTLSSTSGNVVDSAW